MVTFGFTEGRSPHGPPLPEGAMPLSGLLCICLAPSFLKGRLFKLGYSTLFPWHLPRVPATPAGRRDKPAAAEVGCRMPRGRWSVPGTSGSMGVLALHNLTLLLLPDQRIPAHSFPLTASKELPKHMLSFPRCTVRGPQLTALLPVFPGSPSNLLEADFVPSFSLIFTLPSNSTSETQHTLKQTSNLPSFREA